MSEQRTPQQRPPRAVALANGGVAAAILVVVVAFGVAVSQAAPPSIAAFAPDVQQHAHQKSLTGQQGANALGAALPSSAAVKPSPTPAPSAAAHATPTPNLLAGRPASLHCVGNPPHQTDDPQSPPCKQSFSGSNGGATSPGVTADTINVAWPDMFSTGFPVENEALTNDVLNYVNAHFELYGRKIKLKGLPISGGAGGFSSPNAQAQVQDADSAVTLFGSQGTFASIGYAPVGGTGFYYYDRLAQDRIVSVQSSPLLTTDAHMASSPYEWSTIPGYDTVEANLGDLYCHQLKGHQPDHAGPPTPPQQTWPLRKIAVYYETTSNSIAIDPQPLVNTLAACGVQVTAQALSDSSSNNTAAVNQMEQNGVTTVACMCAPNQLADLMNAATDQTWFPEWLVDNEQFLSYDQSGENLPAAQQSHVIGIDYNNEVLDPQNEFWYRAVREMDSSYSYQQSGQDVYAYYRYEELMILASGIQQAGPNLTPQSFAQGLYDTQYANVGHGAAPFYQAAVSFSAGDHAFFDDAAAIWFSASATSYTVNQGNQGAYCYSNGGDRSVDWLKPDPVFYGNQSCRGG